MDIGKALLAIFAFIILAVLLVGAWYVSTYNGLVTAEKDTKVAWANVDTALQRRFDLIPNLVEIVKGYATHEKTTFEAVTEARAHWDKAATPEERIAAAKEMDGAVNSMLTIAVENYPQLKADQGFRDLQAQLEGTENRISVARIRYNEIAGNYNAKIKSFFTSIVANMNGYKEIPLFEADEQARKAPKINFT